MERGIRNAKITRVTLGNDDGPLTAWLHLDYGGSGQPFGGYSLKGEAMAVFVTGVLEAVGAPTWERLPGTPCRVECSHSRVFCIGHFLEDRWFDPDVAFADIRRRSAA